MIFKKQSIYFDIMKQYPHFYRYLFCLFCAAVIALLMVYFMKPSQTTPQTNSGQLHRQMQVFYEALRVQAAQNSADKEEPKSLIFNGEQKQIPELNCYHFEETKRGHRMDQDEVPIFNSSYRGIVLKNVSRKAIIEWEGQPQVIEWARSNIKQGHLVLYRGRPTENILTIVFLVKLVGTGRLILLSGQMSPLLELNLRENGIAEKTVEVKEKATLQECNDADVLILLENQGLQDFLLLPRQHQLILTSLQSREQIYKIQVSNILRRVSLKKSKPCSRIFTTSFTTLLARQQLQLEGLYEIKAQSDVIYTIWLGIDPMTDNRKFSLVQITNKTHVEVKLICNQNLKWYIKPERPLHKAYSLIQSLNKVDYLRAYIMHFYGNGYTDIKHVHFDWRPYFKIMHDNPFLLAAGYRQISEIDIGCDRTDHENCHKRKAHYRQIIGNGHYIIRKQTSFTEAWLKGAEETLEKHYQTLKVHPAKFPRDCYNRLFLNKDGNMEKSSYPIKWGELHAWIFQKFAYFVRDRLYLEMPYVLMVDYK